MTETRWFCYLQHNSGGVFTHDPDQGIGIEVWVEARDAKQADHLAEAIGLYFDDDGDCSCCGSRWDALNTYWNDEEGEDLPPVAGDKTKGSSASSIDWGVPAYAHPLKEDFYQCDVQW